MTVIIIILVAALALLLAYVWMLRREAGRMAEQLKLYNEQATGKKLDIALFDGKLEALAQQINHQSARIVETEAHRKQVENELRQAVANISHDIRTPLTSIFGYIQLLETEPLAPDERREYVTIIKNRTRRLQALLNDFFELSMIESADYPIRTERVGLTALVSEMLVGFYDSFTERGITPDIQLPDENVAVYADEAAVRRVIENLMLNTAKHAAGNVAIRLERQGEAASLTIENEAPDLTAADAMLLFDRFYRADRTRSTQGSGLGLPIAKSLMEKMGGTMTAELADGKLKIACSWKLQV